MSPIKNAEDTRTRTLKSNGGLVCDYSKGDYVGRGRLFEGRGDYGIIHGNFSKTEKLLTEVIISG